jgi:hypothetical protein
VTTTTTQTSTLFSSPPANLRKRQAKRAPLDKPKQERDSEMEPRDLPDPLKGVVPSFISSACSSALATRTTTIKATATTIVPSIESTIVDYIVPTVTTPATTVTVFTTITDTTDILVTDLTTSTTTSTPVTTISVVATATVSVCPGMTNVDGGGVDTSGTLTPYTNIQEPLGCCSFCWTTTGCGLWFFFPGFGCFVVTDASGPDPSTQCPTGLGEYVVILASGYDGNLGGPGPCGGSFAD